jgi:hypothetical protein
MAPGESMMHLKTYFVLIVLTATAYACGGGSKPRVFFVEPQDGATVKSPVHLKFGIENYQVAAVPQGTVDTARPNMGHYHVAVDSDCLSAGTTIQKAAPWVHFGTGNSEIDMQLPPGMHKLTLELGDDMHRAVEGLCTSITVNVTE